MPITTQEDVFTTREQWLEEIQLLHDYFVQLSHDRGDDLTPEEQAFLALSLEREKIGVVKPYTPQEG